MDAIGVRRFDVVGVSYGGFVAYRMAAMYPEAVDRAVMVCAGVCLEETDLAAGLFPVAGVAEAAELLVPSRPADVRRLVHLTFVRPPPIMPSCFLRDYINVMGSDHNQEKTELLHTLINGRKLSDLPKISQPTLIIWGEQDQVFPMELAHRLESFSLARDRFLRRRFFSAGLRPFSIRLPSPAGAGTSVHVWAPRRPARGPVLLLHGFGASTTCQWASYLRPLLAAGFDPIVPDFLFFGDSCTLAADGSEVSQATAVKAAMDAIGLSRFHWSASARRKTDFAAGLFPVAGVAEAAELLVPSRPADVRRLVHLTFVRPPPIMPSCFLRDYINVMGSDHNQEKTELLHTLINGRKLSDLPKISQPTLIIWGEQDQVFPMELAHRLERHLGEKSRLVVIKKAGHAVNLEKDKEVCKNIVEYLREPILSALNGEKHSMH
ncbi:hypothetical protein OsJ_11103 [Oryza sativa Japonica Group]|uniref:AB hydrolase-1 domain-containing protein n=1 Tax=Oryza sativa subsp. japonica TaxID=39947 RepID=B9F8S9_ORYSJ|nr:hypothetical protein OsJ_11103 [Oryza sativa Japonica Group]